MRLACRQARVAEDRDMSGLRVRHMAAVILPGAASPSRQRRIGLPRMHLPAVPRAGARSGVRRCVPDAAGAAAAVVPMAPADAVAPGEWSGEVHDRAADRQP